MTKNTVDVMNLSFLPYLVCITLEIISNIYMYISRSVKVVENFRFERFL